MREEVEISMRGRPGLTGSGNIEAILYIYGHTTRLVVYKDEVLYSYKVIVSHNAMQKG